MVFVVVEHDSFSAARIYKGWNVAFLYNADTSREDLSH